MPSRYVSPYISLNDALSQVAEALGGDDAQAIHEVKAAGRDGRLWALHGVARATVPDWAWTGELSDHEHGTIFANCPGGEITVFDSVELLRLHVDLIWPKGQLERAREPRSSNPIPKEITAIDAFLNGLPIGALTVPEMEKAVVEKFNVTREIARARIADLEPSRKLARGQRRSNPPTKSAH
jgi:hypothetical protein